MLALLLVSAAHSKLDGSLVKGRRSTSGGLLAQVHGAGEARGLQALAIPEHPSLLAARGSSTLLAARPQQKLHKLTLIASLAAGLAAGVELLEDASEVGHAHGVALMAWSRAAFSLKELVESAATELEELEGTAKGLLRKLMGQAAKVLTSKLFLRTLSVVALAASAKEVLEDVEPGGHHAAVLVALNDVFEDLEGAGIELFGLTALVLETGWFQLTVHGGAALLALLEVWGDVKGGDFFKVGGHHGVALIALCGLLKEGVPVVQRLMGGGD